MGRCSHHSCSGNERLSYNCNRCGRTLCSDHRLPESHICIPEDSHFESPKWFAERFKRSNLMSDSDSNSRAPRGTKRRSSRKGGEKIDKKPPRDPSEQDPEPRRRDSDYGSKRGRGRMVRKSCDVEECNQSGYLYVCNDCGQDLCRRHEVKERHNCNSRCFNDDTNQSAPSSVPRKSRNIQAKASSALKKVRPKKSNRTIRMTNRRASSIIGHEFQRLTGKTTFLRSGASIHLRLFLTLLYPVVFLEAVLCCLLFIPLTSAFSPLGRLSPQISSLLLWGGVLLVGIVLGPLPGESAIPKPVVQAVSDSAELVMSQIS